MLIFNYMLAVPLYPKSFLFSPVSEHFTLLDQQSQFCVLP